MNFYFRFAETAAKVPDKIALIFRGQNYTYRDLERRKLFGVGLAWCALFRVGFKALDELI